jgi:hypothetical protein
MPVREITVAQAPANLSAIGRRINDQCRNEVNLNDAAVAPLADAMVGDVGTLSSFFGAGALLLLAACVKSWGYF